MKTKNMVKIGKIWYVVFRHKDSVYKRSTGTSDYDKAKEIRDRIAKEIDEDRGAFFKNAEISKRVSVKALLNAFYRIRHNDLSFKVLEQIEPRIERMLRLTGNDINVSIQKLPAIIEKFKLMGGRRHSTKNTYISALRKVLSPDLKHYYKSQGIDISDLRYDIKHISSSKLEEPEGMPPKEVMEAIDSHAHELFGDTKKGYLLARYAGLRPTEIRNLKKKHLINDNGKCFVSPP